MAERTDKELVLDLLKRRGVPHTVDAEGRVVVQCDSGLPFKVDVFFIFRDGDALDRIGATVHA